MHERSTTGVEGAGLDVAAGVDLPAGWLLGVDVTGKPVVKVTTYVTDSTGNLTEAGTETWLVSAPGVERRMTPAEVAAQPLGPNLIQDVHGAWFGADDGIYIYTAERGKRKISGVVGTPANGCA